MSESKFYGMLGLAKRSGNITVGFDRAADAVRCGSAFVVLVSSDCSDKTKKRIADKCSYYGTELVTFGTSEKIGGAIGSGDVAVLAVTDENFAAAIKNIYNNLTEVAENGSC